MFGCLKLWHDWRVSDEWAGCLTQDEWMDQMKRMLSRDERIGVYPRHDDVTNGAKTDW